MPNDVQWPPLPGAPKSNYPRPALGNPSLERATDQLRKLYPKDMAGVDIQPDWSPNMFTSTQGSVRSTEPKTIYMNPMTAALDDQQEIERVAGHELEHVRQFGDPSAKANILEERRTKPYRERGYEQRADAAGDSVLAKRTPGAYDARPLNRGVWDPDQIRNTVDQMQVQSGFFDDLQSSPAVKGLMDVLNKR